jgi:hypothetical protein
MTESSLLSLARQTQVSYLAKTTAFIKYHIDLALFNNNALTTTEYNRALDQIRAMA